MLLKSRYQSNGIPKMNSHYTVQRDQLDLDNALLTVANNYTDRVFVATQLSVCNRCPLESRATDGIPGKSNVSFVVDTAWSSYVQIRATNGTVLCNNEIFPSEGGHYLYNVTNCKMTAIKEGWPSFVPIMGAVLIYATLVILYDLVTFYLERRKCDRSASGQSSSGESSPLISSESYNRHVRNQQLNKRETSLDAFRGLIIVAMIFINYGGGGFVFFKHSPWYGLTVADLIFPAFILIMGVAIPLR